MNKQFTTLTLAAVLLIFSAAHAAMVSTSYTATSAVGSGSDHSLWISTGLGSGIGSDFDFSPDGLFTLFDDGTATLTGTVVSQDDNTSGFNLSFNYDNTFNGFTPSFKSENGSAATADTIYRDLEGGTLIGFGLLNGLNLSVTRRPPDGPFATQIGEGTATNNGANNKNSNFGAAHWLTLTLLTGRCNICSPATPLAINGIQADINIDLTATPVPLPATALLFASGLFGLLGLQRRKAS